MDIVLVLFTALLLLVITCWATIQWVRGNEGSSLKRLWWSVAVSACAFSLSVSIIDFEGDESKGVKVHATLGDISSTTFASAATKQLEDSAYTACRKAAQSLLNHPSTYRLSSLPVAKVLPSSATVVVFAFKARNSFNLEVRFRAQCVATSTGEAEIVEVKEI